MRITGEGPIPYTGPERRYEYVVYAIGTVSSPAIDQALKRSMERLDLALACLRKEGGWNYDITRGGVERRRDHPCYEGYWEEQNAN